MRVKHRSIRVDIRTSLYTLTLFLILPVAISLIALGAAEAGVQPGDIILEADGQPVSVTSDLLTVRRSHSVGDTIRLTIQRDGQSLTVDVVLYASK